MLILHKNYKKKLNNITYYVTMRNWAKKHKKRRCQAYENRPGISEESGGGDCCWRVEKGLAFGTARRGQVGQGERGQPPDIKT